MIIPSSVICTDRPRYTWATRRGKTADGVSDVLTADINAGDMSKDDDDADAKDDADVIADDGDVIVVVVFVFAVIVVAVVFTAIIDARTIGGLNSFL
jgi:hypothetical protein